MGSTGSAPVPLPPDETGVVLRHTGIVPFRFRGYRFTRYGFELRHQGFTWTVHCRFKEFDALHTKLGVWYRKHGVPLPVRGLPTKWGDGRFNQRFIEGRAAAMTQYLTVVVSQRLAWQCESVREFFEVGVLSFHRMYGRKGREGWVSKRSGGRRVISNGDMLWASWSKRWLIMRDGFLAYFDSPTSAAPVGVFTVDDQFQVMSAPGSAKLKLANRGRELTLQLPTVRHCQEWAVDMANFYQVEPRRGLHPSSSFAPIRSGTTAVWLVDAQATFAAAARAMLDAKSQIFIADWWMNLDTPLVREGPPATWVSLRDILAVKTAQGVDVFVLLYKELTAALPKLRSSQVKHELNAISPRVHVLRHPNHISLNPSESALYWSHHEKLIVVDQSIAFLGGIDLTTGRYDTPAHSITDVDGLVWPDSDYVNPRLASAVPPLLPPGAATPVGNNGTPKSPAASGGAGGSSRSMWETVAAALAPPPPTPASSVGSPTVVEPFSRATHPRMGWHDVHVALGGAGASDIAFHFADMWNHHRLVKRERKQPMLIPATGTVAWWASDLPKKCEYPGVETPPDAPINTPDAAATAAKWQLHSDAVNKVCPMQFRLGFAEITGDACEALCDNQDVNMSAGLHDDCVTHAVRCVAQWSLGVGPEMSIRMAYTSLIANAHHFVYIENQFFISSNAGHGIKNDVVLALLHRIRAAIRSKSTFRAVIVLPVHPEGDPLTDASVQAVMYYQYLTISRGAGSVLASIQAEFPDVDPFEYVSFYSLRQLGAINGTAVTDQVYIHSKVLIVDDRVAVIGSANINDRSMLAHTDTEVCVVVDGSNPVATTMNGTPWQANSFAHSLRLRLWREHLGVLHTEPDAVNVADPVLPSVYKGLWMATALHNTTFYETHFPGVLHFSDLTGGTDADAPTPPETPASTAPPPATPPPATPPPSPPAMDTKQDSTVALTLAQGDALDDMAASAATTLPMLSGVDTGSVPSADTPRGTLVWFSFGFLRENTGSLQPKGFSAAGMLPAAVFQ